MTWSIILLVALIGVNAVYGLFRGWVNALERLVTVLIALYVSLGLACLLQMWTGFELLTWVQSTEIINPEAIGKVVGLFSGWIIGGQPVANVINTTMLGGHCSIIVALLIFLVVNKLSILLYHVIAGIGRTTEKIQVNQGKKKLRITHGVVSTIFGALIGALQGVIICAMFFAPFSELIVGLQGFIA